MVLWGTKADLCEHKCFLGLELFQTIKILVVIFKSMSVLPAMNNEDSFEISHAPDLVQCLL